MNYGAAYNLGAKHALNNEKKQNPWPKQYPDDLLHKAYNLGYKDHKRTT